MVVLGVIDEIKQAEARAEAIEQKAMEQAHEIVKKAQLDAEILLTSAEREARQQAASLIEQAKREAELELQPKRQRNAEKCEEIKKEALSHMDEAIGLILAKLEGS